MPPEKKNATNRVDEVKMDLAVVLGMARVPIESLLNLSEGSLIQLDHLRSARDAKPKAQAQSKASELAKKRPSHVALVDAQVNGESFASGEVVAVAENFGVRLIEVHDQ